MEVKERHSLAEHNTFGIKAVCTRFIEYTSVDEAVETAAILRNDKEPFIVIGAGSNLLLTGDYNGTVVHSGVKGKSITEGTDGNAILRCGSGETWDDIVQWTVSLGYPSLVNLSLIPGDAGAAAVQNIGAYGAEICQFLHSIQAVETETGRRVTIMNEECEYAYRDSRFKREWKGRYLITHVALNICRTAPLHLDYGNIRAEIERRGIEKPSPSQLRQAIIDIRRSKLPEPSELGNAGSFFMNPIVDMEVYEALAARYPDMPHYHADDSHEKIPAGWLIEKCGWKGKSVGRAGVYEKQALVLVNRGGASGQEIVDLCRLIQDDVYKTFNISIKPEVNIV
jgi:UDP-N-acetylmuramate dehydrogenase